MSDKLLKQAEHIVGTLRRHPRVVHQELVAKEEQLHQLLLSLPLLVPFGDVNYHELLAILDWDHRIPSTAAILRVFAFYSETTFTAGSSEFSARCELIERQDVFPEFDVSDFVGLTADEVYEAEVEDSGAVQQFRLTSNWRRDIDIESSRTAVNLVRQSEDFNQLLTTMKTRPEHLGDLEAVCWTPPCESAHPTWTIDVWFLTELNDSVGQGRSFLVDLEELRVIGVREFMVRSG